MSMSDDRSGRPDDSVNEETTVIVWHLLDTD